MSTNRRGETVAVILTLLGTMGAVAAPFYRGRAASALVINLTGVAAQGIWTDEPVSGTNYWRPLRQANPIVQAGREVIIQLQSADNEHGFSIPELGIGPVKVEAGHVAEVRFTPQVPGRYAYQCTTRCGPRHEAMTGSIVVVGPAETPEMYLPPPTLEEKKPCHH
jgi:heme/copper-type cytochrome/quinol oxidase subunit 2